MQTRQHDIIKSHDIISVRTSEQDDTQQRTSHELSSLLQTRLHTPNTLVAFNSVTNVFVYDIEVETPIFRRTFDAEDGDIKAIAWYSKHEIVIVLESEIFIWDVRADKITKAQYLPSVFNYPNCTGLLVIGRHVFIQFGNTELYAWDSYTNTISPIEAQTRVQQSSILKLDDDHFFVYREATIQIWNANTKTIIEKIPFKHRFDSYYINTWNVNEFICLDGNYMHIIARGTHNLVRKVRINGMQINQVVTSIKQVDQERVLLELEHGTLLLVSTITGDVEALVADFSTSYDVKNSKVVFIDSTRDDTPLVVYDCVQRERVLCASGDHYPGQNLTLFQ